MNIPVIIAAKNEAASIGRTLDVLSQQSHQVEPLVIVNGSTDATADIAREAGATTFESDEGKMRAIQAGFQHLGKRALEPLLILDADTQPLSKKWSLRMTGELAKLGDEHPSILWGPYIFSGEINPALGALFSMTSMRVSWADRHDDDPRTIRGGNTGLTLRSPDLLESMLALENYWPRQDVAIYDKAIEYGAQHKVVFHPEGWVKTSGYRISETIKRIVNDRRHPSRVTDSSYEDESPVGSRPYSSIHSRHKNKNPDLA